MAIKIIIDGTDRSSAVDWTTVSKKDQVNQQTDTLNFSINYFAGQAFRPTENSTVQMTDDATGSTVTVFGGRIYSVNRVQTSPGISQYQVSCKDYAYDLGRYVVTEEYDSISVHDIIADFLANYSDGTFTMANVHCDFVVTRYVFNRINVVDALQKLADLTSFSWYVDYNKDIHFFPINQEPAPFSISDYNGNYVVGTLQLSNDFSQIRNRVFVLGGIVSGLSRSETFNGDTVKFQFVLANDFQDAPSVTVASVAQTVGLDTIDNDTDFQVMWNASLQIIRFTTGNIPASGTNNIVVTGIPQFQLAVEVEDPASIALYGVFEYAIIDNTIVSRDEAVSRAQAEILTYTNGITEAQFTTYTAGLRAGQVININSTELAVNESYLIQSTSFKMLSNNRGQWTVQLATLKTINLTLFLISLLRLPGTLLEDDGQNTVLEKTVFPIENIGISEVIGINTNNTLDPENIGMHDQQYVQTLNQATIFVAGPYIDDPTTSVDVKRVFVWDGSTLG